MTTDLHTFTIINDSDLIKARQKGQRNANRKSVAIYRYTNLRTGKTIERYFTSQAELNGFLKTVARGGRYAHVERIDIEGHKMPEEERPVSAVEVAAVRTFAYDSGSEHRFRRVGAVLLEGDKAADIERTKDFLDRLRAKIVAWKAAGGTARLNAREARGRARTKLYNEAMRFESLAKRYSAVVEKVSQRISSDKDNLRLLKLVTLKKKLAELRKRGAAELEKHPEIIEAWKAETDRIEKVNKRREKKGLEKLYLPRRPRGLPATDAELDPKGFVTVPLDDGTTKRRRSIAGQYLYWQGKAIQTRRGVPKVSAAEGTTKVEEIVPVEGLDPEKNEASYLLSLGRWPVKDEHGRNAFTAKNKNKLYNEYAGVLAGIVSGKAWREGAKKGWLREIPGAMHLKEDLMQEAALILYEVAELYTPAVAKEKREKGINFRMHVIAHLENEIRKRLKKYVDKNKKLAANIDPDVYAALSEVADPHSLDASPDPTAARASVEKRNISGEEILLLKDVGKILDRHLSTAEEVLFMSRFNLHNTLDNPKGGRGLKAWSEVAKDLAEATGKSQKYWTQKAPEVWLNVRKRLKSKVVGLKAEEWSALMTGLKLLIKITAGSKASPGNDEWIREGNFVEGEKGSARSVAVPRLTGVVRHLKARSAKDKPLRTAMAQEGSYRSEMGKVETREIGGTVRRVTPKSHTTSKRPILDAHVSEFWEKRPDAVAVLGLGNTIQALSGFTESNVALPRAVRHKKMLVDAYRSAWSKLLRVKPQLLVKMPTSPEFTEWRKRYDKIMDLQAKVNEGTLPAEKVPAEMKPTRKNLAFTYGDVTVSGVHPVNLPTLMRLVYSERRKLPIKDKRLNKSLSGGASAILPVIDELFRLAA